MVKICDFSLDHTLKVFNIRRSRFIWHCLKKECVYIWAFQEKSEETDLKKHMVQEHQSISTFVLMSFIFVASVIKHTYACKKYKLFLRVLTSS